MWRHIRHLGLRTTEKLHHGANLPIIPIPGPTLLNWEIGCCQTVENKKGLERETDPSQSHWRLDEAKKCNLPLLSLQGEKEII